jgi:pimeloyl-ACP methyl ester carboxylesterase
MEPLWERLPELTLPVKLIAGERDAKFRAVAERMAERLPSAEVVLVPGAGHSFAGHEDAVVTAAVGWLTRVA